MAASDAAGSAGSQQNGGENAASNGSAAKANWWSPQEDKVFERVLSEKFGERLQDILEEISKQIETKDMEAVRRRYEQLEEEEFGKGDWRSISRNFVVSRTPTQVASHAQKYFIRLSSMNKRDKRRASIHDITSVNQADVQNMTSVHAARANGENLTTAQNQQGKPIYGGGMVSMPPASYVSNMMPQSGPQQYV